MIHFDPFPVFISAAIIGYLLIAARQLTGKTRPENHRRLTPQVSGPSKHRRWIQFADT